MAPCKLHNNKTGERILRWKILCGRRRRIDVKANVRTHGWNLVLCFSSPTAQASHEEEEIERAREKERRKSRNYIFHHADNNHFVVCIMKKKNEIIGSHNDECRQHSAFLLMCILLPSSISHRDIVCAAFVPYTQSSVCELFVRSVHIKQS